MNPHHELAFRQRIKRFQRATFYLLPAPTLQHAHLRQAGTKKKKTTTPWQMTSFFSQRFESELPASCHQGAQQKLRPPQCSLDLDRLLQESLGICHMLPAFDAVRSSWTQRRPRQNSAPRRNRSGWRLPEWLNLRRQSSGLRHHVTWMITRIALAPSCASRHMRVSHSTYHH